MKLQFDLILTVCRTPPIEAQTDAITELLDGVTRLRKTSSGTTQEKYTKRLININGLRLRLRRLGKHVDRLSTNGGIHGKYVAIRIGK